MVCCAPAASADSCSVPRGQRDSRPGTWILSADFDSPVHGHSLQPDHHAKLGGPLQPGGRRARGAPVLPAREGTVFAGAEILPVLHVRARLHGSGEGHSSVQVHLRASQAGLRGSHEQVRLPVAGATALRELPRAGGRAADLCGPERLLRRHRPTHHSRPGDPRSPRGPRARQALPVSACSQSAPLSEL